MRYTGGTSSRVMCSPIVHPRVVAQTGEEGLDVLGDADSQVIVCRICHIFFKHNAVARRELLETLHGHLPVPRLEAEADLGD